MKEQHNWACRLFSLAVLLLMCIMAFVSCDEVDIPSIHQHTIAIDSAVEPTCAKEGLTAGAHCYECGAILAKQETVSKLPHTIVIDEAVESTCDKVGLTSGAHCSVCGEILVAQSEVSPKTHTYDDKYDAFCNVCGYERDAECAHTNQETIAGKPATCTSEGLSDGKKCAQCGEILVTQIIINKISHTAVIDAAVSPTCTQTGLTEGSHCSVCNTVIVVQTEIPLVAHTYDDKYDENCNVCGFIRDAECAHRETEVIKGYEATCTTAGLTDGTKCKKCGELLLSQEVIPVKEHAEVIDKAVEATCVTSGLTEGKHCSVCGIITLEQTIVPTKAHTEEIDAAVTPTCKETGLTEGSHCSACGEVLIVQMVIDIVDHNFSYIDGNCQYCGINSYLVKPKEDIEFLTKTWQELEDSFDDVADFISEHSTRCNNSACTIEEFIDRYERYLNDFYMSRHNIQALNDKLHELENAETLDMQKLNELKAGVESMFWDYDRYVPSLQYYEDGLVLLETDIDTKYQYCHISSVVIPAGVTSIDNSEFSEYSGLTSVTIPDSVTSIGLWAFANCTNLTNVNFNGTIEQWNAISKNDYYNYDTGNFTIYCTDGTVAKDGTVTYY